MKDAIYGHTVTTLAGETLQLERYRGQVLLIVNTASQCGFTPQYAELEALYRDLHAQGLEVLAFPCNQFGAQEPGSASAIGDFCHREYAVTFPVHEKIDVNGPAAHPLFVQLKHDAPGILGSRAIKWNFTKFLVNRDGLVCERFAPSTRPEALRPRLVALLNQQAERGVNRQTERGVNPQAERSAN